MSHPMNFMLRNIGSQSIKSISRIHSLHASRIGLYSARSYSVDPSTVPSMDQYELMIFNKLNEKFDPVKLQVSDVSGGCGSMFAINIVSNAFKGIPMVKQHRLVNECLSDEIKKWHGLQLVTKAA